MAKSQQSWVRSQHPQRQGTKKNSYWSDLFMHQSRTSWLRPVYSIAGETKGPRAGCVEVIMFNSWLISSAETLKFHDYSLMTVINSCNFLLLVLGMFFQLDMIYMGMQASGLLLLFLIGPGANFQFRGGGGLQETILWLVSTQNESVFSLVLFPSTVVSDLTFIQKHFTLSWRTGKAAKFRNKNLEDAFSY
jgi:hypothetical protein